MGAQRGGAGNETVHQHRHAVLGALQIKAGHGGDFQAAQLGQRFQRRQLTLGDAGQRGAHHPAFDFQSGLVQPCAAADNAFRRQLGQSADQRRGRGGIAYAHVAGDQQVGAAGQSPARGLPAHFQRGFGLCRRHRGLLARLPVPARTLAWTMGSAETSLSTPASTTSSRAPRLCASTQMAAPPLAKLRTISPVTTEG